MAAAKDDLNVPLIIVVGALFVILTFVTIVLLQAYFFKEQAAEYTRKAIETRSEELASVQAEQLAELQGYRWIDRNKGVVGIPIERAMELVAAEAAPPGEGQGGEKEDEE